MRMCIALALVAGCAHAPARPPLPAQLAAEATAGVTDPALRDLLARHWDALLREEPLFATSLGDHRFDAAMPDFSPAGYARPRAARDRFLDEARALPAERLGADDRTTLELFVAGLRLQHDVDQACATETWTVSVEEGNPLRDWAEQLSTHVVRTRADADNLLARLGKLAGAMDDQIANLRLGAARGRYASAAGVDRVLEMVDGELARPARDWGWVKTASTSHEGWTPAEEERFTGELAAVVDAKLRPALVRWRRHVADEIRPHARTAEGIGSLPGGDRCYAALIAYHTTLPRTPAELHALGEKEIARIDAAIEALGARLFGTRERPAILARLRTDPKLYFSSAAEVEDHARRALAAAKAKIPQFFGILPKADCVVEVIPEYEAPYTTIAYYARANADGSLPGRYMINSFAPTTRPRYEASVLAYHESIPGHHLQIAIAQERAAIPAFRRNGSFTAFVVGWGLYSEHLAGEMDLYDSDLDRMGQLSYQAWRAARLVVDTGIHAMGWTREQAVQYMLAHSALAENNIRNEVDRYIGRPAQALAYKVGELTILRLRDEARAALGARFDIKAFHDVVLGAGAVTLDVLERRVHAAFRTP